MSRPLFVSPDSAFISRIQKEGGAQSLMTSSYVEGLRWIGDPEIPISGIYFDPTDSSYSALRFLGITLMQRPATPIFILDAEGDFSEENRVCLIDKFKIRGFFKGQKSWTELTKPTQTELPQSLRQIEKRVTAKSVYPGYLALPITDFVHSKKYPFNVFVEDGGKTPRFFAMEGSEIDAEYLTFLSRQTSWVYIEEESIQSRKHSFHLVQSAYLDPAYLSPSWRSAETLFRARTLLNEMRKGGVSSSVIEHTYSLLEDVFQLMSQLSQEGQMRKFVEQARQCDRTMACTTLAVLMCRKLRFEKTAIMESLGLASFLQDVSLYNSPWGNMVEMDPANFSDEAKAFYQNHPSHSADLVSKVTHIPDVTLQVIRQHHERIDRTGFPHRVGGAQLQPMAEILSMINFYLELKDAGKPVDELFQHYSERVTVAFRQVLNSLS